MTTSNFLHSRRALSGLLVLGGLVIGARAEAQTNSLQLTVPRRGGDMQQITEVRLLIDVPNTNPVTFTFTQPGCDVTPPLPAYCTGTILQPPSTPWPAIPAISPGDGLRTYRLPAPGTNGIRDEVRISAPATSVVGPLGRRYTVVLNLRTDYDVNNECKPSTGRPPTETWTIAVAGTGISIAGHCAVSFDFSGPGSCGALGSALHLIDANSGSGNFASVVGATNAQRCAEARPALDAMLVLDRSCSMDDLTQGTPPRSKLDALKAAVRDFTQEWMTLRGTETAPPADRMGVVFFDSQAMWMNNPALGVADWTSPGAPVSRDGTPLVAFDQIAPRILAGIDGVSVGGATSIGSGLHLAASSVTPVDSTRTALLLMSNGLQNTHRMVRACLPGEAAACEGVANVVQVTGAAGGAYAALPNGNALSIHTVTVGRDTAVSATILERVAQVSGGFYLNTEDQGSHLRPFFLEILQNFLRYNSYQSVKIEQGRLTGAPQETTFKLTAGTRVATLSVTFASARGNDERPSVVEVAATPPDGGAPIVRRASEAIHMPLPGVAGEWKVQLRPADHMKGYDYAINVIADDHAFHGDLVVQGGDRRLGEPIVLQAKLSALEAPVLSATTAGGRVEALAVLPGQSLGDVLSAAQVTGAPGTGPDVKTPANAKLDALAQSDPSALRPQQNVIALRDDGASPDAVARDGVYTGSYLPKLVGHYHFLIRAETGGPTRFIQREEYRTVHVRATPYTCATGTTEAQCATEMGQAFGWTATSQSIGGVTTLVVRFTPRTQFKNLFGPGWADHFVLQANGAFFRPIDNLDGSYTANIPYSGDAPNPTLTFDDRAQVFLPDDKPTQGGGISIPHPPVCVGMLCGGCGCKGCTVVGGASVGSSVPWAALGLVALVLARRWRRR